MENFFAGAFGCVLGVVGIWLGRHQLKALAVLRAWPTATGQVIERGTFRTTHATLSVPAFQFSPLVRYAYRVGGRDFVNDRIHPQRIQHPDHSTRKWAETRATAFPAEVAVHYNAADPAESFLILTPRKRIYVLLACSCVALLIGGAFLLVAGAALF